MVERSGLFGAASHLYLGRSELPPDKFQVLMNLPQSPVLVH